MAELTDVRNEKVTIRHVSPPAKLSITPTPTHRYIPLLDIISCLSFSKTTENFLLPFQKARNVGVRINSFKLRMLVGVQGGTHTLAPCCMIDIALLRGAALGSMCVCERMARCARARGMSLLLCCGVLHEGGAR